MRRVFAILIAVAAAAAIAVVAVKGHRQAPQYVFLICLDAVRPDHLGCYGYGADTSPSIDALAGEGFLFEDAVSQAPWTTPSIATVLTSTFPSQHGARRTEGSRVPYSGVPSSFIETLRNLGYQTALFTGGIAIKDKVPGSELVSSALRWLRENMGNRCCVVIHDYETHSPYIGTPACIEALDPGYSGPFKLRFGEMEVLRRARVGRLGEVLNLSEGDIRHIKALYDCQIIEADKAVGSLVDSLAAWDRLDRSMIIVFSDHGEEFLEHGSIDHGQTVYEESIRVPLVIYCPAFGTKPVRIRQQAGLIDLAPTIFDALRIKKPATFEGITLLPLMSGRAGATRETVRPCGIPAGCLVAESIARRSEKKALRCPPWKLIFDPFYGASELYDISTDPGETANLIEVRPDVASRLADTLLVMSKYYPGGWCIAWRGAPDRPGGQVEGKISVEADVIEAVPHDFFPGVDTETDSLITAQDWRGVRFFTPLSSGWKGVEIRMEGPSGATVDVRFTKGAASGASRPAVRLGETGTTVELPAIVKPEDARVERANLRDIFLEAERTGCECVIFWTEPGSEPTARARRETELRQQLKAIGYVD